MLRPVQIFLLLLVSLRSPASRLSEAYEALAMYDYFKARKLFYKINARSVDPYAAYGLATIYHRSDNPFHNLDSAMTYANKGNEAYAAVGKTRMFGLTRVDAQTMRKLADSIAGSLFVKTRAEHVTGAYDHFLSLCFAAPVHLREAAIKLRDELEYNTLKAVNQSDTTAAFIITHPESSFRDEAVLLYDRQVFEESTSARNAAAYLDYLRHNKTSSVRHQAFEKLFSIYRDKKDISGLAAFVSEFPDAPQNLEAWKLLFSLSVRAYSFAELKRFIDQYPAFPLRSSILRELELNKLVLYPYVKHDLTGYINENGELAIPPSFEAATAFSQGLALVQKGDSVYFINKDNKNPFSRCFEEAGPFRHGLAPVKMNGAWVFINPLGLVVSKRFEEIGEMSNNAYVVKRNNLYGAVDQFGQTLIEPRFEKLGDVVNDAAYYTQNGSYGFVTLDGYIHPAEFDWISDFSGYGVAVIKVNGRFGLVDRTGRRLLDAAYDQVVKQNDSLYVTMVRDQYGFFAVSGCFVHAPVYDYLPVFQSSPLTDGKMFRLNRRKQQNLADANGVLFAAWTAFEEVWVPSEGLARVKRKNKFGYADLKGNTVIPCVYTQAADFSGGCALVKSNEKYLLINRSGKEIYSSDREIRPLGKNHFTSGEEPSTIISTEGTVLFLDASGIQQVADGIYAFERPGGEIRLLYD